MIVNIAPMKMDLGLVKIELAWKYYAMIRSLKGARTCTYLTWAHLNLFKKVAVYAYIWGLLA